MSFSDEKIQKVWEKGKTVSGYDSSKHRKDACNAWMTRDKYGNKKSIYGWEVDHITPKSKGGSDSLSNLRPLQWENNRSRADGNSSYCVVTSKDNKNIRK